MNGTHTNPVDQERKGHDVAGASNNDGQDAPSNEAKVPVVALREHGLGERGDGDEESDTDIEARRQSRKPIKSQR